jgi:ADP-ribosylglycohydrolase
MALALADSISCVGWDINDQARRYLDWFQRGKYSAHGYCDGSGRITRAALRKFMWTQDAFHSGDDHESASGNGSIMRLAPVPIRYHGLYPNRIADLARLAEESSLPTHANEECLSACRYMTLVLAALIHGKNRNQVLSPTWEPLVELNAVKPLHPLILAVASGSFREKQLAAIKGSGYVVESLEAALWAFHDAGDFEEAVLKGINLGHDTDTTGSVAGQFAGAFWGESGIPLILREELTRYDNVDKALAGLCLA